MQKLLDIDVVLGQRSQAKARLKATRRFSLGHQAAAQALRA